MSISKILERRTKWAPERKNIQNKKTLESYLPLQFRRIKTLSKRYSEFDRFLSHSLSFASSITKHILSTQVLGDAEIKRELHNTRLGWVHGLCPPEAHSLLWNQAHFTHPAYRKSRQVSRSWDLKWVLRMNRSWPESTCSHMGTHCSVYSIYWLTNLSYKRIQMPKAWRLQTDKRGKNPMKLREKIKHTRTGEV